MIQDMARWFSHGGLFMWAILAVMAFATAITIERLLFYFAICKKDSRLKVGAVIKAINEDRVDEARQITRKSLSPANTLISVAVEQFMQGSRAEQISEAIEEAAIDEIPRLTERLNYLSLCANIATLLGLLGTIQGLQLSFGSIGSVEAAKKATMLAQGISVAMNTTAFGLIVAVPCMIVYTWLFNIQQHLTKDIDRSLAHLMNYFSKKCP